MLRSSLAVLGALVAALLALVLAGGRGWLGARWGEGEPTPHPIPGEVSAERARVQEAAAHALGERGAPQILFGDLHVHSTYSADAFQLALPLAGGEGPHPVADACDFARFCSELDFWSINDHALSLTPERWSETVDSMRRCAAVAGDPEDPDVVPFLGWEWTQVGSRPENHYGHKNVILRDLDPVPTRPIAAGPAPGDPPLLQRDGPPTLVLGALALAYAGSGGPDLVRYLHDTTGVEACPTGRPVRELPAQCREQAATPSALFAKLDDWGYASLVIPHGTTWGMYTPGGSSWDKQLVGDQHDPGRQRIIEVYSGHGSSEEYRSFRAVEIAPDGTRRCPRPSAAFLPPCWQAGEIIRARCRASGASEEDCDERAAEARANHLAADGNGGRRSVPGERPKDWADAGQCRDCFLPAFNYRPASSVQYILSLGERGRRFRFGLIGSSDNHSSRPGTGYKELAREVMTEARFLHLNATATGGLRQDRDPAPQSVAYDYASQPLSPFARWETERAASFFLTGGLAAVHARGRSRGAIFDALERREVYGTSGPRILLWFDVLNSPAGPAPMGSSVRLAASPEFRVRAIGSREQLAGCPEHVESALSADRVQRLCRGECYNPGPERRLIDRIEVVRIRPRRSPGEPAEAAIDDPWQVHLCPPDARGCEVRFRDASFGSVQRETVYYVRAIERASSAIGADPLRCRRDAAEGCVEQRPCAEAADDCLAETEERAWSSPIFVDPAP